MSSRIREGFVGIDVNAVNMKRYISLDLFRGVIMVFLLLESTFLFENLETILSRQSFGFTLLKQFFHVPWIGLHFWDLIQPGFMYIAGVAMVFSYVKRMNTDNNLLSWRFHILKRSAMLLIFGVGLHWIYNGEVVFEFQNILTQLAFTTLITALFIRRDIKLQLVISIAVLILSTLLYRLYSSAEPFKPGNNIGSALDKIISGHSDSDHWVSLNFLSTTAHTMWGAITGWIIINSWKLKKKIIVIGTGAFGLIIIGLILHITGIEPIIKRIATIPFVMVSGGICILVFISLFLLFDSRNKLGNMLINFFVIVGLNSLFIYLFSQTIVPGYLYDILEVFIFGIGEIIHISDKILTILSSLAVFAAEWGICYWLYRNKITIRL